MTSSPDLFARRDLPLSSFLTVVVVSLQRFHSKVGGSLSKATVSGMQSGGEEEPDEEVHTPLPPPMEIIKDSSAQEDKVGRE